MWTETNYIDGDMEPSCSKEKIGLQLVRRRDPTGYCSLGTVPQVSNVEETAAEQTLEEREKTVFEGRRWKLGLEEVKMGAARYRRSWWCAAQKRGNPTIAHSGSGSGRRRQAPATVEWPHGRRMVYRECL